MALVSLGTWQVQRLEWKRSLISRIQTRVGEAPMPFDAALAAVAAGADLEYQPVRVRGVFDHDRAARVFATQNGAAGYLLFTPLRVAPEGPILVWVNRGFAPQTAPPGEIGAPGGEVEIVGLMRTPERPSGAAGLVRPKDQPQDNLYFIRDPAAFARSNGAVATTYYVDSSGAENNARWPLGGLTRVTFPNRHLEYALTWYGLAAALAGVYFAFSFRR
jgi:surfeit locus 1 family protein